MKKSMSLLVLVATLLAPGMLFAQSKPLFKVSKAKEIVLFNGTDLGNWAPSDFLNPGKIEVKDSCLIIGMGYYMSGVTWQGELYPTNYEISLEAMRVEGDDFFCGLTFPVKKSFCSLIVGGWGGTVVGLSSLNDLDASENEATNFMTFESQRWYHIRLIVTDTLISAYIDQKKIINADISRKRISIRSEVAPSRPLGFATYWTKAALRRIVMKRL